MADLWGAALVVCYIFYTSPHAPGIVVFKVPLDMLLVPAFRISVGQHVTCPAVSRALIRDHTFLSIHGFWFGNTLMDLVVSIVSVQKCMQVYSLC